MRSVGADDLALGFAAVTIIVASLLALGQDNLKARLAFSTVSQLSYILLGAALLGHGIAVERRGGGAGGVPGGRGLRLRPGPRHDRSPGWPRLIRHRSERFYI